MRGQGDFLVVHRSSLNPKSFPQDKCFCNLSTGSLKNSAKGRTGYPHPLRRLFLVETFKIREPDCFKLVKSENDLFGIL